MDVDEVEREVGVNGLSSCLESIWCKCSLWNENPEGRGTFMRA